MLRLCSDRPRRDPAYSEHSPGTITTKHQRVYHLQLDTLLYRLTVSQCSRYY